MLNFAYGSNLLEERLLARVPQARLVGVGWLPGWRFALNIRSEDGSAKANAIHTGRPEDVLHGALYELDAAGKAVLDRFEDVGGAYRIEDATAGTATGSREVYLYVGNQSRFVENLPPYDWYLGFILAGARQRGLPVEFVRQLGITPPRSDTDLARAAANWAVIPAQFKKRCQHSAPARTF
jgi:gamma-glutamylcyclotransferase